MADISNPCLNIQKSLHWCQGTPELPGIRRRLYYIAKSYVVQWPSLKRSTDGRRPEGAQYQGSFTLLADTGWHAIDILPDKSTLTSEAQGELPSQTQLNKLTAVHPAIGPEAAAAAAYINNADNVFIVQDMEGRYRVIGCERWLTKSTVAQDLGQGASGNTSTTISAEAPDEVPAPFYTGSLTLDDGTEIDCSGATASDSN